MAEYFNRDFSVQVGPRLIRARPDDEDVSRPTLRITFNVEKGDAKTPNQAEVTILNLSDNSRSAIQEKGAACIIEAGYVNNTSQIFAGDLQYASTKRSGPDWVTTFQTGDGSAKYRGARISESLPKGTQLTQAIEKAAGALGVGLGNAVEKIQEGNFRGGLQEFARGVVLQGRASDELDKLLKTAGLQWSIQDGQLQLLRANETTDDQAVVISSGTGMIGSPEVGEKGEVTVRTLLQGLIRPGGRVQLETEELNGLFKVGRVNHVGDTWGNDWYTELEAKPL